MEANVTSNNPSTPQMKELRRARVLRLEGDAMPISWVASSTVTELSAS